MSGTTRDGPAGMSSWVSPARPGTSGEFSCAGCSRTPVRQVRSVARRPLPPSMAAGAPADRLAHTLLTCGNPRRGGRYRVSTCCTTWPRRSGKARPRRLSGTCTAPTSRAPATCSGSPGCGGLGVVGCCVRSVARQPAAHGRRRMSPGRTSSAPTPLHKLMAEQVCLAADRLATSYATGGGARASRRRQGGAGCPWVPSGRSCGHRRSPGGAVAGRGRGSRGPVGRRSRPGGREPGCGPGGQPGPAGLAGCDRRCAHWPAAAW